MIHVLKEMFGWPNGNVLGNLIASGIVGLCTTVHLRRHVRRVVGKNEPPKE